MPGDGPVKRTYVSPLREGQANRTRDLILDALVDLLGTHFSDEVSTKQIAERAGVSQPTVYRHFPDRMALIEGLAARAERAAPEDFAARPQTLDDWAAWIEKGFLAGDAYPVEVAAEAVLSADPRRASHSRRGRSERFLDIVARSLPDLGEHDVRRVAGLLRVLGSVQTWLRMREEYGLDGAESGPLVIWAVKVLEREIRAGHLPEPPS